jgi:hypothetical protein
MEEWRDPISTRESLIPDSNIGCLIQSAVGFHWAGRETFLSYPETHFTHAKRNLLCMTCLADRNGWLRVIFLSFCLLLIEHYGETSRRLGDRENESNSSGRANKGGRKKETGRVFGTYCIGNGYRSGKYPNIMPNPIGPLALSFWWVVFGLHCIPIVNSDMFT